jgi:tRNA (guanine-N7-)-methyltransferase
VEPFTVTPARPAGSEHVIRTYRRRGGRLNAGQQRAWDTNASRLVLPHDIQIADGFRLTDAFDRAAPLAIEVGCGVGEAVSCLAINRPDWNIVGFEVWQPGIAQCLAALADREVPNLRLSSLDAAWCLEHIVEPSTIAELWTFFPDPWQKARHHKRRLVGPAFAALVASRLAPGGWLRTGRTMPSRCATCWTPSRGCRAV